MAASTALGQPPALGVQAGSVSLLGGHGTAIAWAPVFSTQLGIDNALEVGILCATAGLVLSSVFGGPLAHLLIGRYKLVGVGRQVAKRVREVGSRASLDIASFELVDALHSHDSAAKAVELVRAGRADTLMKESLHTDELMGAVVSRDTGIRTARRINHCFVMDIPGHAQALIISDAAVNIAPTLEAKGRHCPECHWSRHAQGSCLSLLRPIQFTQVVAV